MNKRNNQNAKGRSQKAPTFTLKAETKTLLTTQYEYVADYVATALFAEVKSVSLYSNAERRVIRRWNYGHLQPLRGSK